MAADPLRFLRFDRKRRLALLMAIADLFSARMRLALSPVDEVLARLADGLPGREARHDEAADFEWALIAAASRVPWRSDCLVQAIAAHRWARRNGTGFEFHLGVRRDGGELVAHAWTLSGGHFLSGRQAGMEAYRKFEGLAGGAGMLRFD